MFRIRRLIDTLTLGTPRLYSLELSSIQKEITKEHLKELRTKRFLRAIQRNARRNNRNKQRPRIGNTI